MTVFKQALKLTRILMGYISPTFQSKAWYFLRFGKRLNLKNPKTLHEKLSWLKLYEYANNPLVIKCSDKYRVREYVSDCGLGHTLNELYDVFSKVDEINWDTLPEQFALKWNFGAGGNIICEAKHKLNKEKALNQLKIWGNSQPWLEHSELHYKHIPKRIVSERYIREVNHSSPTDYKVYCFNGKALAILVMQDRNSSLTAEFFDVSWNHLKSDKYTSPSEELDKPDKLTDLLSYAEILAEPFPFVRVDFYIIENEIIFGEMTFTPAGCIYLSQTKVNGLDMSEYLTIT